MRKLLLLCIGMLLAVSAFAQEENPTANWPYLYPDFTPGQLLYANKAPSNALFNIHLNQSVAHYVVKGKIRVVDTWGVTGLVIGDDEFRFMAGKMLKVLAESEKGYIVQEIRSNYAAIVRKDGAYGTTSLNSTTTKTFLYNENAINQYDGYLLTDDYKELHAMKNQSETLPVLTNRFLLIGQQLIPANKKNVAALESIDKKAFSAFLKANKIDWKNNEDLLKVVDFLTAE